MKGPRPPAAADALAILLTVGVVGGGASAFAQSYRPLATEPAEVLPTSTFVLEVGAALIDSPPRTVDGPRSGTLIQAPVLGFQLGLGRFAELRAEGAAWQHIDDEGETRTDTGDLRLWTKLRFLKQGARRPALAWRFGVKLPNAGEPSLGLNTTDFFTEVLATQPIGRAVRLDGNLGLAILGDPDSAERQDDAITYGAALRTATSRRIGVGIELHGTDVRREQASATAGLWYHRRRHGWDMGISKGVSGVAPEWTVSTGWSWHPGRAEGGTVADGSTRPSGRSPELPGR